VSSHFTTNNFIIIFIIIIIIVTTTTTVILLLLQVPHVSQAVWKALSDISSKAPLTRNFKQHKSARFCKASSR